MRLYLLAALLFMAASTAQALTPTPTFTPTTSPTPTLTFTYSPTSTITQSFTVSPTPTFTATLTASPTATRTPMSLQQIYAAADGGNVVIELSNSEILKGAFVLNTDSFMMGGFIYPLTYIRKFKTY